MAATPTREQLQHLRTLATTYRTMIALVGIGWACWGVINSVSTDGRPGGLAALLSFAWLGTAVALIVYSYRLAKLLDLHAILWAILMAIPLINLVALLRLSSKAQAACRERGVKVGFIGPDMGDLLRIERAVEADEAIRASQAAQAAYAAETAKLR